MPNIVGEQLMIWLAQSLQARWKPVVRGFDLVSKQLFRFLNFTIPTVRAQVSVGQRYYRQNNLNGKQAARALI